MASTTTQNRASPIPTCSIPVMTRTSLRLVMLLSRGMFLVSVTLSHFYLELLLRWSSVRCQFLAKKLIVHILGGAISIYMATLLFHLWKSKLPMCRQRLRCLNMGPHLESFGIFHPLLWAVWIHSLCGFALQLILVELVSSPVLPLSLWDVIRFLLHIHWYLFGGDWSSLRFACRFFGGILFPLLYFLLILSWNSTSTPNYDCALSCEDPVPWPLCLVSPVCVPFQGRFRAYAIIGHVFQLLCHLL